MATTDVRAAEPRSGAAHRNGDGLLCRLGCDRRRRCGGGRAGLRVAQLRRRGRFGAELDGPDLARRLVRAGGALGLYLVLVAIVAYGAGGYVAGRMRGRLSAGAPDEIEFRDGVHGAAVWALATLLTALIVFGGAQALTRVAAPSSGPAGPSTSVAGENIIAYDVDRLFRGTRSDANIEYSRAEAARILLTASSHRGMLPEDRTELIRLVTARTGLGQPEAERRVDDVIARAKENISRARKSAVILAFSAGASALLGLVIAWFAACEGGRHRDGTPPSMVWGRRRD